METIKQSNNDKVQFDEKLNRYIQNIEKANKIYDFKKELNKKNIIESRSESNEKLVLKSKELVEGYRDLIAIKRLKNK